MNWTKALLPIARAGASLALIPTLAWSAPTPPPPAPPQQLGEVRVVEETPGTKTIVDSAGRRHVVMRKITPADRKAAAARARATRDARRARDAQQKAESSNAASDQGAIQ